VSTKKFYKSAALVAIGLFLTLNGSFTLSAAIGSARIKGMDQNGVLQTIDSAVQQYRASEQPDVVLLGSSLIMSPVWTADFHRYGHVGDFYRHHRSYQLEKKLEADGGQPTKVFSFAVPGAMVSDMDLIVDKVLTGAKKPSLVVYGVAPRDFMDDLAGGETKTATFSRLGEVSDLSKQNFAASTTDEKLELVFNRACYLFGKRTRYQAKTDDYFRKLAHTAAAQNQDQFATATNLNVCPLFQPKPVLWQKSLDEYRMRYQRFNQTQFKKQELFLQDMISTCDKNGIRILLVNMPLTETNIKLMPDGLYDKYRSMLRDISAKNNVSLLDLTKQKYKDDYFYDTVHLNDAGAEPFLTSLNHSIRDEQTHLSLASRAVKPL
jgi:hypothetical protein